MRKHSVLEASYGELVNLLEPKPSVHPLDRGIAIQLNDLDWSSKQLRVEMLLPIGIALLKTAGTDRTSWWRSVFVGLVSKILPFALDAEDISSVEFRSITTYQEAKTEITHPRTLDAYFTTDALIIINYIRVADHYSTKAVSANAKIEDAEPTILKVTNTVVRTINSVCYSAHRLGRQDQKEEIMKIWRNVVLEAYKNNP